MFIENIIVKCNIKDRDILVHISIFVSKTAHVVDTETNLDVQ